TCWACSLWSCSAVTYPRFLTFLSDSLRALAEVMSVAVCEIEIGYFAKALLIVVLICFLKPLEIAKTTAIEIIPMLEAKAVSRVRPFFVIILVNLNLMAFQYDILVRLRLNLSSSLLGLKGSELCRIFYFLKLTIFFAIYFVIYVFLLSIIISLF